MGTHGLPNQPDTNRGQTLTESIDYSSKENIAGAAIDELVARAHGGGRQVNGTGQC